MAEKGTELGGPWSDHLEGPVWELRVRLRDVAARMTYWRTRVGRSCCSRFSEDQAARSAADRQGGPGAEDL
nr:hypothetical protein [Streptosporangium brasiliense]